jgi:predicted dithiol-disulfide oxidoreductase (DUF899 family)
MRVAFPNESAQYRQARDGLLNQEIELRRQTEALAAARRALPAGGEVAQDYVFEGLGADGHPAKIRLSELFREGTDTLMFYCYMFPRHATDTRAGATTGQTAKLPKAEQPCPSCTGLLDQLNAAVPHYEAGGGNFAVVANTSLENLLNVARDRDWQNLRMLSSAGTSFKRDYLAEDEQGQAVPLTLVFQRDGAGKIRFFWASELMFAPRDPGQDPRAAGTLEPFWNMFDLGPGGRPDFMEQLQYDCCRSAKAKNLAGT